MPPEEAVNLKMGRKPIMSKELEQELVNYLVIMESKFYGLTRADVRRLAFQLCERNGVQHPFSKDGIAGRAWFDHFMNRHKDVLSLLKPTATSFSRAYNFNQGAVNEFSNILEAEFERHQYPPQRIFNVDESGITIVQSKTPRVVGLKGKKQVGALSSAERGGISYSCLLYECWGGICATDVNIPQEEHDRDPHERSTSWFNWEMSSIWMDSRSLIHRVAETFHSKNQTNLYRPRTFDS